MIEMYNIAHIIINNFILLPSNLFSFACIHLILLLNEYKISELEIYNIIIMKKKQEIEKIATSQVKGRERS